MWDSHRHDVLSILSRVIFMILRLVWLPFTDPVHIIILKLDVRRRRQVLRSDKIQSELPSV